MRPNGYVFGHCVTVSVAVLLTPVLNSLETVASLQHLIHFPLESHLKGGQLVLGESLLRYEFFKFSNNYCMNSDLLLSGLVVDGA